MEEETKYVEWCCMALGVRGLLQWPCPNMAEIMIGKGPRFRVCRACYEAHPNKFNRFKVIRNMKGERI